MIEMVARFGRLGGWLGPLFFAYLASIGTASALEKSPPSPPGCMRGDCGLRGASAYAGLVIGTFQHVESEDEMRRLYRWGEESGVWKDFDDGLDDFLARNRVVHVTVGAKKVPFILILSRAEYDGAPPIPGDLVRYVPLRAYHDAEGRKAPSRFSVLSGCVAMLCRGIDANCRKDYVEGFFSNESGKELDPASGKLIENGKEVDPMSARPKRPTVDNH